MKKLLSFSILLFSALAIFSSCSSDDDNKIDEKKLDPILFEKVIPANFGASYDELKSNKLVNEGTFDENQRICIITPTDEAWTKLFGKVVLHFDLNKKYRYASVEALSFDKLNDEAFQKMLKEQGWIGYDAVQPKDGEKILKKDNYLLRIFLQSGWAVKTPTLFFGPDDQAVESWMRIGDLKSSSIGVWAPLAAIGCHNYLFEAFEQLWGHQINQKRTNVKNGFYAYNTGDPKFPMVGYYYDMKTDSWLEESTIYMDYDNPPKAEELEKYVESLGFFNTGLVDKNGNKFFYNRTTKVTCGLFINNPNKLPKEKFTPRMDFMLKPDIEDNLPQEKVDIPWPPMGYNKITLKEAVAAFEKMGYKVTLQDGVNMIINQNKDFPQIYIWPSDKSDELYGGVFMSARDEKVVNSPDIVKQILERGYVRFEGPALPTYINEKEDAEVQVNNIVSSGMMGLGFNSIDVK